jgi:hypothetical protein
VAGVGAGAAAAAPAGVTRRPIRYWLELAALIVTGLALAALVMGGRVLPSVIAIVLLALLATWGILTCGVSRLSVLPRLMILLYSLPYSATIILLVDSQFQLWSMPYTHALTRDPRLIGGMTTIGVVGLLGLLAGIRLLEPAPARRRVTPPVAYGAALGRPRVLGMIAFVGLALAAVGLSWLYAPTATIFAAQYAAEGTTGAYRRINFNGAYLLSYLLMGLLFIDAERSRAGVRRAKMAAVLGATAWIVVFLQVLRGDRESIGLLAGLMALYLTMPLRVPIRDLFPQVQWRRARRVILPMAAVIVIFIGLGSARFIASSGAAIPVTSLIASGAAQNTWTFVLLTNLGMAAEWARGEMTYLHGATYLDYLLSLPPGVITNALGLERAIEAGTNPNYWYSEMGGIHAIVVPFRNFGAAGAFLIMGLSGAFVAWVERRNEPTRFWPRLLYASVVISSFMWFWYGDMNIIRGLMGAAALGLLYQGLVQLDVRTVARAVAAGTR